MSASDEIWKMYFESVKMLKLHKSLKEIFFSPSLLVKDEFSISLFHCMCHVASSQSAHEAVS